VGEGEQMSNTSEFDFVVEKNSTKKSIDALITVAEKHGAIEKESRNRYKIVIDLMTYNLSVEDCSLPNESKIVVRSVATPNEDQQTAFLEFCFDVCREVDPLHAMAGTELDSEYGFAWEAVEHHRNAYFFCLDTKRDDGIPEEVIRSGKARKKVEEIEKKLSFDRLTKLLEIYSKKVSISPNRGVTIFKGDSTMDAVALRYYLVNEVRKKGIDLEVGSAEEYAKVLGIK
jgi:hypothetical protein